MSNVRSIKLECTPWGLPLHSGSVPSTARLYAIVAACGTVTRSTAQQRMCLFEALDVPNDTELDSWLDKTLEGKGARNMGWAHVLEKVLLALTCVWPL